MSAFSVHESARFATQSSFKEVLVEGDVQAAETAARTAHICITESINQIRQESGGTFPKKSVVLLGITGSGKTTLVNALYGNPLIVYCDKKTGKLSLQAPHPLEGFIIGESSDSETRIPRLCMCSDLTHPGEKVPVIDLPGLEENRGVIQEIVNAICIKKVFEQCKKAKLLAVLEERSTLVEKGRGLMNLIIALQKMFSHNIDGMISALSLVVTSSEVSEEVVRNRIRRIVRERESSSDRVKIAEALCQRIVLFKKPKMKHVSHQFKVTKMVHSLLSCFQNSDSVLAMGGKMFLSDNGVKVACAIEETLARGVSDQVATFMNSFSESIKEYTHSSVERFHTKTVAKRLKKEKQLRDLLQQLRTLKSKEFNSIETMLAMCEESLQFFGAPSAKTTIEKISQRVDLIRKLGECLPDGVMDPMDMQEKECTRVRDKVKETFAIVDKGLSKMKLLQATKNAAKEAKRAGDTHRQAKQAKRLADEAKHQTKIAKCKQKEAEQLADDAKSEAIEAKRYADKARGRREFFEFVSDHIRRGTKEAVEKIERHPLAQLSRQLTYTQIS